MKILSFGFYYERGKGSERLENFIKCLGIISFHYEKAITNSIQCFEKKTEFGHNNILIFFLCHLYIMLSVEHE
mgnify:CR=1 FL=1